MRTAKRKPQSKPLHKHVAHHVKRWLVPHTHNDHRPHLIRAHGLAIMAVLVLGLQGSVLAAAVHRSAPTPLVKATGSTHGGNVLGYATGSITPVELLNLTNQERAASGLPALRLDSRLNNSAGMKAQDMFANDYWNHVSPGCVEPWHWFSLAGYNYTYAGENLAKDFDTAQGVMDGWMNSPGHRANILNPHYTDVGFAVENGQSPYDSIPSSGNSSYTTPTCSAPISQANEPTTSVVAHYGATAAAPVAAANPATASPPRPTVAAAAAPAPAPTATPVPQTPTPTLTPAGTPPVVRGQISEAVPGTSAPAAKAYSLFRPLSIISTLHWNTLVTIALLLMLLIVYALTHMVVWRKGLSRWRNPRYRMFAAAQLSSLTLAILSLAASGFGKVG